jgi:ubiquinone/menaquinone biosynthesis C-methylase UbiE
MAMTITEQQTEAFKEFEKTGWDKQAEHYHDFAGQVTWQTVDAMLSAINLQPGTRMLDVASGPGYVAAEATRRGADATGTDIAREMVEQARRRFAGTKYETADAEHLHYVDASFDAVTCAFGMLHFPRPGKAMAEAFRVLRRDGRFAFSVWCGPTKAKVLAIIMEAMQRHADNSVSLPTGPGPFMLSDPWVLTALMEAASFSDVHIEELPSFFAPASPRSLFEMMRNSTVRVTYLFERQTQEVQARIEQTIIDDTMKALAEGAGRIPWPALLISGKKV